MKKKVLFVLKEKAYATRNIGAVFSLFLFPLPFSLSPTIKLPQMESSKLVYFPEI
jgi:hypothetical protein